MADVSNTLVAWSNTTGSNNPSGATNIGTGLDDNLREIQGVIVRGLSHKGSDIASATTPALGGTEGLFHDITGTATITGFDTVREGLLKIAKFEGAATLTHNASSLILPGGANITTANGDVAIFISEGSGNWRCLDYLRAANFPTTEAAVTTKGDLLAASAANVLSRLAVGSNGMHPVADSTQTTGISWTQLTSMVSFTRDIATASGSQAVTGVGFTPVAVIFIGAIAAGVNASWGWGNASQAFNIYNTTNASVFQINATKCISISDNGGNSSVASIASLDSDGFTLTWTKTGSPTGTATIYALCLR